VFQRAVLAHGYLTDIFTAEARVSVRIHHHYLVDVYSYNKSEFEDKKWNIKDRILLKYRQHILMLVIHLIFLFDGFTTYGDEIQCLLRNLKMKIESEKLNKMVGLV